MSKDHNNQNIRSNHKHIRNGHKQKKLHSFESKALLGVPDFDIKSRGAQSNIAGRFEKAHSFYDPEYLNHPDHESAHYLKTQIYFEQARSIITKNSSPDIHFDYSINPYRGCEHGCSYCFARPTHSYLDLSPGLDFESKLFVKENAPQLLVKALCHPGYQCRPIALGTNTDCYQPIEKTFKLTRRILEICLAFRQPVAIVTKGSLLLRDIDLLTRLNQHGLVSVAVSVTTLNNQLKALMEPRAASIQSRMQIIKQLVAHNIPVSVLVAPLIPKINDHELEDILKLVAELGVKHAGYVLLRLPHELAEIFKDWLQTQIPLKAESVLSIMRACHEGEVYRSQFGIRQTGTGHFAELIQQRFQITGKKLNLNTERLTPKNTSNFSIPKDLQPLLELMDWQKQRQRNNPPKEGQLSLF